MEKRTRVLPPEVLVDDLLAAMQDAQAVPLVISGSSMVPFLAHGRDTVYLSKLDRSPKRGDMIFYRRDNGTYILHRVFRAGENACDMVGDAQTEIEPGIRPEQVLAVVNTVRRKGKLLKKGNFWWDFFEGFWLNVIPLRPVFCRIYRLIFRK